ncbi:MAG: sigma-70 family RNA polymerase sigma factor [Luteolibacter sp.]
MASPLTQSSVDLDDDSLVVRTLAGDLEAFGVLLRRELPGVRAFVALKLPVPHLIDEIAHETFVHAFHHLREFETGKPFRPWLRAIAGNLIRQELQRFARQRVNLDKLEQARADHFLQRSELVDSDELIYLEECLGSLPEVSRVLVEERYRHARGSKEIAERCGRSDEWVRVTLYRIREQLRNCIEFKLRGGAHEY